MSTDTTKPVSEMTVDEMIDWVENVNRANGWFESDRSFGDDCALIHSEISEMLEAWRQWGPDDATAPLDPERELWLPKPEGIGSEMADVMVRAFDTARRKDVSGDQIDFFTSISVADDGFFLPEHETFGDHVSTLHSFVTIMFDETWPVPDSLNELLAYLQKVAYKYKINLSAEFERKMKYNATRGHRHGGKLL